MRVVAEWIEMGSNPGHYDTDPEATLYLNELQDRLLDQNLAVLVIWADQGRNVLNPAIYVNDKRNKDTTFILVSFI